MTSQKIRIGCVPEHYSYPLILLQNRWNQTESDTKIECIFYKSGTGAMLQDLDAENLDMAFTLTEGTCKAIADGMNFYMTGVYVESPILWGVHTPAAANFTVNQHQSLRLAVSRPLSGSHLMGLLYLKKKYKFTPNAVSTVTVGTLEGAINTAHENKWDIFLWEKFTTQHVVDAGIFDCIDEFGAPWPAFVCTVSAKNIPLELLKKFKKLLSETLITLKKDAATVEAIHQYFSVEKSLLGQWIESVTWQALTDINTDQLQHLVEEIPNFATTNGAIQKIKQHIIRL